jgi:NAD(P)H-dependent flavin oxidoreductase YrpB (nitropropane dioxygenase family)
MVDSPHVVVTRGIRQCTGALMTPVQSHRSGPRSRSALHGCVCKYAETRIAKGIAGVDVLTAQGMEAGAHMGPTALGTIVPTVVRVAGDRPVLAAGGIVDGCGLAAAFCLGASGVSMGTRFLATPESPVSDA